MSADRRRVAIVGGGFGGLAAAQALRKADVDVTLVDRTNHHLFQPLLYQLASGMLSMGDCAAPIRGMLRQQSNVSVAMAEVTEIDAERRELTLDRGERLGYDSLIVACGADTSYFGHDEWQEPSFALKTLSDAVALREQILSSFEEAERAADAAERERFLTFVVIGGGPTGVEIAGQLAVLARHHLRHQFTRFDPRDTRVVLLDAGERVLTAFSPKLSAKAARRAGLARRRGARGCARHRDRRRRRLARAGRHVGAARGGDGDLGGRCARGAVRRRARRGHRRRARPRRPARGAPRLLACPDIRRSP